MAMPNTTKRWDGPSIDAWSPWTPTEVAEVLAHTPVNWCVVGGWAIDAFIGQETRPHDDIEISIPRGEFPAIRAQLENYALHAAGDEEVWRLDQDDEFPEIKHQCWVLDGEAWRLDIMIDPGDARTWACRRDLRIHRPRAEMIFERNRVPYLRPEGVLLYKAKATRAKDELDFAACQSNLESESRRWLKDSLSLAHPGHPWIQKLDDSGARASDA